VQDAVRIPLLHIGDVAAKAVTDAGLRTVGLLGSAFTMEQEFYVDRLGSHGLTVLVPDAGDLADVHRDRNADFRERQRRAGLPDDVAPCAGSRRRVARRSLERSRQLSSPFRFPGRATGGSCDLPDGGAQHAEDRHRSGHHHDDRLNTDCQGEADEADQQRTPALDQRQG
jgi:hypothetical protein